MAEKTKIKNQRKLVFALVGIIIILVIALAYFAFLKGPTIPKITTSSEATQLQQNISQSLTDIKNTLQQINQSLTK